MSTVGATVVKMTSRGYETLKVGFRCNNIEAYFHMSLSLMCSDGQFPLVLITALKCQIITNVSVYMHT